MIVVALGLLLWWRRHSSLVFWALWFPAGFLITSYGVVLRRGKFLSPQAKRFLTILDEDFFSRPDADTPETMSKPLQPKRSGRGGDPDLSGHDNALG